MEKKSIHSTAASLLRKTLNKSEQVPTPGKEPNEAEPKEPAENN